MRMHEIDKAIPSLPPSSRELFRRRREIHDAANRYLWRCNCGPFLGRDDSIIRADDEVYVVDHEATIDRLQYFEDDFHSPIQRVDYMISLKQGVVLAQMCKGDYIIPTHKLLSTTGCFVLGMIKVQRKFRFNKVFRMLGTYQMFPSSLQHFMQVRELVARFLCGPPVQYKPRHQCLCDCEEYPRLSTDAQQTCMAWRMLYRQ